MAAAACPGLASSFKAASLSKHQKSIRLNPLPEGVQDHLTVAPMLACIAMAMAARSQILHQLEHIH